ncbi:MAG TPA: LamG domain-containing protein, partial [Pilimelia sp.]|nr:LamG domain-containing protein [Pilimelia sp.]
MGAGRIPTPAPSGVAAGGARPARRRRHLAAAAATLAVVTALVVPAVRADRQPPAAAPPPAPPVADAPDTGRAAAAALRQGSPVTVADQTTPTRIVRARPDGTLTAELSPRPVRVRRGAGWVPVDTTLSRRSDGTLAPRATTTAVAFSAGGTAPLVRVGAPGARLTLRWPGRLPAPAVDGDTATYREVLPGVDLRLRAEPDGYVQHLVIHTRRAAAQPALAALRLGLRAEGLTVRAAPGGGLAATDRRGRVVLAAPPSAMWDATGTTPAAAAAPFAAPSGTARRSVAAVTVGRDALVLRPDRAMLADPRTRYPVVVDPDWRTAARTGWAKVFSGKPTTSYWLGGVDGGEGKVGNCAWAGCNGIGVSRLYVQYDTGFLAGKRILSAAVNSVITYGPSCPNVRDHELFVAHGQIGGGTTWNNAPQGGWLDTRGADTVYGGCSGHKPIGFDTKGHVNAGGVSTYFIKARDEGDGYAWRKYDPNATNLVVHFNTRPNAPYDLSTQPPLPAPCTHCGGKPWIGSSSIRLLGKLSDPESGDSLRGIWDIYGGAPDHREPNVWQTSGATHSIDVDLTGRHGQTVSWTLWASDGTDGGPWVSGPGPFVVDTVGIGVRPEVTGTVYPSDGRWHGGVGVPGQFTFSAAGVADVDHYRYGWTHPDTVVPADSLGGSATVTLTPPGDGPRTLYVRSVDRAGHQSPTTEYRIYVRAGNGPLARWAFEGNTDDDAFLGDRNGTLHGGTAYGPGAVGTGLRLDAAAKGQFTAPHAVRTDASFSVSAWARVDTGGAARSLVSQDGGAFAGFNLWYRPENGGRWVFGMAKSGTAYAGTDMAIAPATARLGVWTHLTGVYDGPSRTLRLYVNGVLAATAARTGTPWHAAGGVRVGATTWNGAVVDHVTGAVDEVALYDRAVTDEEVRAAVSHDHVQVAHWRFDEPSGTTAGNTVPGGAAAVLRSDAAFTPHGAVKGAVRLTAPHGHVTTGGPVLHTDESYSVAAWLKLDAAPAPGETATALAQDGAVNSAFFVGYRALSATTGAWEFYTPSADAVQRPDDAAVRGPEGPFSAEWTHVAAVYDALARQMRVYVNGALAGSAPKTVGFDATGPLVVGRGRWHGNPGNPWSGAVDELRAYSRVLSAEEIAGIVTRDNVRLGAWPLDGTGHDLPARRHDATLSAGADWTAGHSATGDDNDLAVRLDGATGHVAAPHVVDTSRSFSVAAWAKLDRVGGHPAVLSQDGNRVAAFQLQATPGGQWAFAMFSADVDGGGAVHDRVLGAPVQVGVWTHLAGVYDAGNQRLSLYVNGVLTGTGRHAAAWHHPAGSLTIGRSKWGGNPVDFFPGAIDDVAVYSRPLFAAEVRAMAGRDLSLVHQWRLDESSGSGAADAVGARRAELAGGATFAPGRTGNALQLDGVDDTAGTADVDLRTDAPFTVSAWVYLDRHSEPVSQFTAVGLEGERTNRFRLGHVADELQNYCLEGVYPDDPNKCGAWIFEVPSADSDAPPLKAAVSTLPAEITRWVHLTGVYDPVFDKIWLYVNGSRVGDGTAGPGWTAGRGLRIGRAKQAGAPAQHWPGRVDDVRLYTGALSAERIAALHASYPDDAAPAPVPTGTEGHWRFDENTGTQAADSSGKNRPATLRGGTGWVGGRTGAAAWLDGTSGYAETAGPVLDTTNAFSVSAWVYLTSAEGNRTVVAQDGNRVSAFLLQYEGATKRWAVRVPAADQDNPAATLLTSSQPAARDDWTHLTLTYTGGQARQLRLYVNGLLSAASVGAAPFAATGRLSIGRAKWNGQHADFFPRGIDDVRVWRGALTAGQVRTVHDDVPAHVFDGYRFDDGTGRDYRWRANPLTLTGGVSFTPGISGQALRLDGTSGAGATAWFGVTMRDSFTVSGWARLSRTDRYATVLAQDGNRNSGFQLQYRPDSGRWTFGARPPWSYTPARWVHWPARAGCSELTYACGAPSAS